VIVIDDHSDYACVSQYKQFVCQNQEMNIQFISLPDQRVGAANARNFGVQHARGEIIGFLDDDSIPESNWIFIILSYFAKYPQVVAVTGTVNAVDYTHPLSMFRQNFYNTRYKKNLHSKTTSAIQDRFKLTKIPEGVYLSDSLSGGNSAIRLSALQSYGVFNVDLQMMHDKELALRLLSQGCICTFLPSLVVRHNHTKSVLDAMSKSFRSGRSHYFLRSKYSNLLSGRVLGIHKPFISLVYAAPLFKVMGWKFFLLIPLIFGLEYLHQMGYFLEIMKSER